MRWFSPVPVLIATALWITASGRGFAQAQDQPANSSQGTSSSQDPNSSKDQEPDAPQPQKKTPAKTKDARDPSSPSSPSSTAPLADSSPAPATAPGKDENPFPEAVSQAAAQSSPDAPAASPTKGSPASAENPFPEDVSRSAAKGDSSANDQDGSKHESQAKDSLPPGVSSSRSADDKDQDGDTGDALPGVDAASKMDQTLAVTNPAARAKKDIQVGDFYLQTGDYRGAYLRYKDAVGYDPTNADAIFGMAEAARALKLVAEARQTYKLYLEIVPEGGKAKEAAKALRTLDAQK
jgi:hypothetical protein